MQSRNDGGRFSKAKNIENSDLEYSDQEYNNPELLIHEFKNSNEEEFNNKKTELNKKEDNKASDSWLLYYSGGLKYTFFKLIKKLEIEYEISDSNTSDLDLENNSSISKQLNKLNNKLKNMKSINAYEYFCLLTVYKYFNTIFNNEESHSYIKLSLEISKQAPLGMPSLYKKKKSKAIMVSEFLTETHSQFTITSEKINELNLLSTFLQEVLANKAISIFEATHPNYVGVFVFDNSTNYDIFTSDALYAKNINFSSNNLPPDDPNYIFHDEPR
ncbi:17040_t:CDS:2, partial [Dentiscutata heterogama]